MDGDNIGHQQECGWYHSLSRAKDRGERSIPYGNGDPVYADWAQV